MSDRLFTYEFGLYSNKSGAEVPAEVQFQEEELSVRVGSSTARLSESSKADGWQGFSSRSGALIGMFHHEASYPPFVLPSALEYAWQQWRNNEVSDEELEVGLNQLFAWVNTTARGLPGGFWESLI